MNKLIYLPFRFCFLFLLIILSFFLEKGIEFLGMSLWSYSLYLFWFEDRFYKVADSKKYKFSFIRLLTKIKMSVKRQPKRFQLIFLVLFPLIPFVFIYFLIKPEISFLPFIIGQVAYLLDHKLRKKFSW